MFSIKLNDKLIYRLESLQKSKPSLNDEIQEIKKEGSISMSALLSYYDNHWAKVSDITMKELVSPVRFNFPEKHVAGSNYTPEFRKQLETLRLQMEEKNYQTMLKRNGVTLSSNSTDGEISLAQINRELKEQITTIFNILVSVVSVIWAIWYWSSSLAPQWRILLCLFFGILILIADVVVYSSYLRKIDEAKDKERKKKEQKKVIATFN